MATSPLPPTLPSPCFPATAAVLDVPCNSAAGDLAAALLAASCVACPVAASFSHALLPPAADPPTGLLAAAAAGPCSSAAAAAAGLNALMIAFLAFVITRGSESLTRGDGRDRSNDVLTMLLGVRPVKPARWASMSRCRNMLARTSSVRFSHHSPRPSSDRPRTWRAPGTVFVISAIDWVTLPLLLPPLPPALDGRGWLPRLRLRRNASRLLPPLPLADAGRAVGWFIRLLLALLLLVCGQPRLPAAPSRVDATRCRGDISLPSAASSCNAAALAPTEPLVTTKPLPDAAVAGRGPCWVNAVMGVACCSSCCLTGGAELGRTCRLLLAALGPACENADPCKAVWSCDVAVVLGLRDLEAELMRSIGVIASKLLLLNAESARMVL